MSFDTLSNLVLRIARYFGQRGGFQLCHQLLWRRRLRRLRRLGGDVGAVAGGARGVADGVAGAGCDGEGESHSQRCQCPNCRPWLPLKTWANWTEKNLDWDFYGFLMFRDIHVEQ